MIRQPIVSGRFYPSDKNELLDLIEQSYKSKLGANNNLIAQNGRLCGMIVPHAGYIFSAPVASWAYARLESETKLPTKIMILGPKHTSFGAKFSVSNASGWATPLGNVKVDSALVSILTENCSSLQKDDEAHAYEHSIEVQLPFLQKLYANKSFEIVPIALGYASFSEIKNLAIELNETLKLYNEKPLIIISSDFSHDVSKNEAYRLDAQAIEIIKTLDAKGFYKLVVTENRSICGLIPITLAMEMFCEKSIRAKELKYATSMDVMSYEKGVGYASIVFEE